LGGVSVVAAAVGVLPWGEAAAGMSLAICACLVTPLLVVVHELGHAVAAVALTPQRVMIRIGGEPYLVRFALGRIDVRFHPTGYIAHCDLDTRVITPGRLALVALAGPVTSIAFAGAVAPLAVALYGGSFVLFWIVAVAAAESLFIGVSNAVPFQHLPSWWPGGLQTDEDGPSDGLLALSALKAMRARELGEPDRALPRAPAPSAYPVTDPVGRIIRSAEKEAEAARVDHLGTEHLLLGLLAEQSPARDVLARFGVTDERVRAQISKAIEGSTPPSTDTPRHGSQPRTSSAEPRAWQVGRPPRGASSTVVGLSPRARRLTPAAKRALTHARSALSLRGDERVDTEHLLLGLIQEQAGLAVKLLDDLGVDACDVRRETILALRARAPAKEPRPPSLAPAQSA
jgi:hypothetical protein